MKGEATEPTTAQVSGVDICAEIDRLRQKLLDLTNSNRLLNYRKSDRRTIEFVDKTPNEIFDRLVTKERTYYFSPAADALESGTSSELTPLFDSAPDDVDESEGVSGLEDAAPGTTGGTSVGTLRTSLSRKSLDSVLTTMRREANTAIEETGVNYLYVAIGLLEWKDNDSADRTLLAPLILIPARLERKYDGRSGSYRTTLAYTGEEVQSNLSLTKRLEKDFDLQLPDLALDDEGNLPSPDEFFQSIERIVSKKSQWVVRRESLLGFFSFRKLLMYLDLDPSQWTGEKALENHPLIRAVIEGTQIENSPHYFGVDYAIDSHPGADRIALVRDADSSQHSALCDIAEGKSLVVEGPPGTGKSQTITNVIANALNGGKSVLFVSEKLAALEVVRSNLESVDLGMFCLELHSDAAKPRQVFTDLAKRLDFRPVPREDLESLQDRVGDHKQKLTEYLASTSIKTGPLQLPLHDVFWRVTELRSRGIQPLDEAQVDERMGRNEFEALVACLRDIESHATEIGPVRDFPWQPFHASRLIPGRQQAVQAILNHLVSISQQIAGKAAELVSQWGGTGIDWITLSSVISREDHSKLEFSESLQPKLLPDLDSTTICGRVLSSIDGIVRLKAAFDAAREVVVGTVDEAFPIAEELLSRIGTGLPDELHGYDLSQAREVRARIAESLCALEDLVEQSRLLSDLGFGRINNLHHFRLALDKYRLVSHDAVVPPKTVEQQCFQADTVRIVREAKQESSQLIELQGRILERQYLDRVPEGVELDELIDVLKAFGSSWTRFFRRRYRLARSRAMQSVRPGKTLRGQFLGQHLETVRDYRERLSKFENNRALQRVLGPSFESVATDWDAVELALNWANTAKQMGLSYEQARRLWECRWNSSEAPCPSTFIDALRVVRAEIGSPAIGCLLGANEEQLEVTPFDAVRARLTEISRDIDRVLELHEMFVASDRMTIQQILECAAKVRDAITSAERFESRSDFKSLPPNIYARENTDWESLEATTKWALRWHHFNVPWDALCRVTSQGRDSYRQFVRDLDALRNLKSEWYQTRAQLSSHGDIDEAWLRLPGLEGDEVWSQYLERLIASVEKLPLWARFCRSIDRCRELGGADCAVAISKGVLEPTIAAECFDLTLHEKIAFDALARNEALRTFSGHSADRLRREYQKLDRELIAANRLEIAWRASQRQIPSGVSRGRVREFTDLGLIRHEVANQVHRCRIRDLIQRAGKAVQALKPCFMMSPLSIAQFLPAGAIEFDIVVMDEASQIKPEDALGTIIRAQQLVVVGDPKQLPPTSFFDRLGAIDDGDGQAVIGDSESILEVALKAFPHRRRLRWHYRSQHESLIAFSNVKFYEGDLVVFPSSTSAGGRLGVTRHTVENAIFSGGCNAVEADQVAAAIVEHAKNHPDESLGVATFNLDQAQAIRDRLESIASHDSEARLALERLDNRRDKLFVKNLENVQGDERDVIFLSYTYGPDPATGRVFNRFGPITWEDGWRRLNVLITRAKRRVEVFSSFLPSDIRGAEGQSRGVQAMKDYLHYAISGQIVDRGRFSGREPGSSFEIAVARVVESIGLKAVPQVGVAGFSIDIGVLRPESETEFLLGIECDGATYHSSKSARDRDRLREEIITLRGWKLHRIWSTDWFLNQDAEEERLRAVLRRELHSQS